MKTATIRINEIFGAKGDLCADIFYRGKLLASFDRRHILDWSSQFQGLADRSKAYCQQYGFSHYKIIFG
jgi:hypothetical protein